MSRELPSGWKLATLNEICSHIARGDAPKYAESITGIWALGQRCIRDEGIDQDFLRPHSSGKRVKEQSILRPGDVCINSTGTGTLGRVGFWRGSEEDVVFADTHVTVLRANEREALPRFLFEWLRSEATRERIYIECVTGSTNQIELSRSSLMSLSLLLPPPHEQRRIAEILSSVDDAIAATRAVIEQTRKVKQGVMERLLTKGIGHTRFKQTEIGEIPEGWETGKIGDFFTLQRGFDITEKQSNAGEYPVVSSSGISYFHSEAMVSGPAVITGRKGKLGLVHFIDSSCWPHDTTLWVRDFKGNEPKFVYWFLRSLNLEKFDAATAVPTLNRNVVHALSSAFPPISEQLLIANYLDSIEATEHAQTRNLASYGQTKSALMSDLLTGRKRITDDLPMAAE
jgi:type I restriction enzyme S subunit